APNARLLTADGRRAEGREAVRELLASFAADLRSTSHRIIAQWHQDNVWIAEVEASYELRDWFQLNALPRAFILHHGPDGIDEQLLVFGDPQVGTLLMQEDPSVGYELPLRVLFWNAGGETMVGWRPPTELAEQYGLGGRADVLERITGLLEQLVAEATAA